MTDYKGKKVFAYYGANGSLREVTNEFINIFWKSDRFVIPKDVNFNEVFGDTVYGEVKHLGIMIDNTSIKITEDRDIKLI